MLKKLSQLVLIVVLCSIVTTVNCACDSAEIDYEEAALLECQYISGRLTISGNVSDLFALSMLIQVQSLRIENTTNLVNLSGLESFVAVYGDFVVRNNEKLVDLSGMDDLRFLTRALTIKDNDALTNFDAISGVSENFALITISGNKELTSIDGLLGITQISNQGIIIDNNPKLPNIHGLSSVTGSWGNIVISNNAALENLDGMRNIFTIFIDVKIDNNAALGILDGLKNLTTVRDLTIVNNPILTDLNGLKRLVNVRDLTIVNNPSLEDIDGLDSLNVLRTMTLDDGPYCDSLTGIGQYLYDEFGYCPSCYICIHETTEEEIEIDQDTLTITDRYALLRYGSVNVETLDLRNFKIQVADFINIKSEVYLANGTLSIGGNLTLSQGSTTKIDPQNTIIQIGNCINFGGKLILETAPENDLLMEYSCHTGQFDSIELEGCRDATEYGSYGVNGLSLLDFDICCSSASTTRLIIIALLSFFAF